MPVGDRVTHLAQPLYQDGKKIFKHFPFKIKKKTLNRSPQIKKTLLSLFDYLLINLKIINKLIVLQNNR